MHQNFQIPLATEGASTDGKRSVRFRAVIGMHSRSFICLGVGMERISVLEGVQSASGRGSKKTDVHAMKGAPQTSADGGGAVCPISEISNAFTVPSPRWWERELQRLSMMQTCLSAIDSQPGSPLRTPLVRYQSLQFWPTQENWHARTL